MMASQSRKIIFGVVFGFLFGCGAVMNKNSTEFDWYATESAPEHYPMKIIRGTFFYKGRNDGLYIPSGGTLYAGWGESISMHVTGADRKPLPDKVEVLFYSYAERQFYRGKFDLPYDRILTLFRKSNEESPENPYYDSIMTGIAPGGAVSVWLNGRRVTEVFFGQAEKIDLDLATGFSLPFESKAEADAYIEKQLINVLKPEELASLKKDGVPFGTWTRYRNQYKWAPSYKEGKISETDEPIPITYLNGEKGWMPVLMNAEQMEVPRSLPRKLQFSVVFGKESFLYIIHFDDMELMSAFEKLGAKGEKVYLEFDPKLPRPTTTVRVYNDKESIELKKTMTEDW